MVTQLIYMSQPFGFDSAILAGILTTARRNNPRHAITGALICRQDVYLQLIEGDAGPIDALYDRIAADDRHLDVTLLSRAEVDARVFPDWAMLHDPAHSWLWSPDEVGRRRDPRRRAGRAAPGLRAGGGGGAELIEGVGWTTGRMGGNHHPTIVGKWFTQRREGG